MSRNPESNNNSPDSGTNGNGNGPGRPRSETVRTAILTATWELLQERALATLTIIDIAQRSGVSKPTIYKWWPSLAAVAAEAFFEFTSLETPFPKGSTAAIRLRRQVKSLVEFYRGKPGKIVGDIISQGRADPETRDSFYDQYLKKRREEASRILIQGVEQGEFEKDLDTEMALDMLYGPIYYRLVVTNGPLDAKFAEALVDRILDAIRYRD